MVLWNNVSFSSRVSELVNNSQDNQSNLRHEFVNRVTDGARNMIVGFFSRSDNNENNRRIIYASNSFLTNENLLYDNSYQSVFFDDIVGDVNIREIEILASLWLVSGYGNRYFPNNHVRLWDLSKVLLNAYRLSVDLDVVDMNPANYVSTLLREWILISYFDNNGISRSDIEWSLNNLISMGDFEVIVQDFYNQYPLLLNQINISGDKEKLVNKSEVAKYVVQLFSLQMNQDVYNSRKSSVLSDDIFVLMNNGLIEYDRHFDVNSVISRKDFVKIMTRIYALSNTVVLRDASVDIVDIDQLSLKDRNMMIFAYEKWWLDYMLVHTKWNTYFYPEKSLSIDEVYDLLDRVFDKKLTLWIIDNDIVVRWSELSGLLVDVFGLVNKDIQESRSESLFGRITEDLKGLLRI